MANSKKNKNKAGGSTPRGAAARVSPKKADTKPEAKKDVGGRVAIICFAVLALVGLTVGGVAFLISYINSIPVDYLNDDLSKYIFLSEEDYKGIDVTVTVDPVTDMDVESAVLQALFEHREKDAEYDGKYLINQTVTPGDKVLVYYRGYMLGENGEKLDFNGGCNFAEGSTTSLEIGSGRFITGFEIGLVGHNPRDYSAFSKLTTGTVGEGALVQLTYSAAYPDGSTTVDKTQLVSLEDKVCDKIFGTGFADFLAGKPIGEIIMAEKTNPDDPDKEASFVGTDVEGWDGDPVFTDMKVTAVYEVGDNPLTVECYFPYNYDDESLRSKTVYYDVYISSAQLYKTPELDDRFITDTLKISREELEEYEGSSLVDKWRNSLKAELMEEYQKAVDLQIEEALVTQYSKNAEVKKLPEREVNRYYLDYVAKWENDYYTYGSNYASLDEYVLTEMGLNYYDDWREVARMEAEAAITDKLAFYFVVVTEGLVPDSETLAVEKELLVLEYLEAYLEEQGIVRSKYDSDEKYEKAVATYREQMLYYYDDAYFEENALYIYAMRTLRTYANVTYANSEEKQ